MSEPNFKGYTVKAVGEKLSLLPFDPKPWEEDDVDGEFQEAAHAR